MDKASVFQRFCLIANLIAEEALPWRPICSEAIAIILCKLKKRIDEHDKHEKRRLTDAAASLSYYRYTLYRASSENIDSASICDIRVSTDNKETSNLALLIWKNAKAAIADLLKDENFFFAAT